MLQKQTRHQPSLWQIPSVCLQVQTDPLTSSASSAFLPLSCQPQPLSRHHGHPTTWHGCPYIVSRQEGSRQPAGRNGVVQVCLDSIRLKSEIYPELSDLWGSSRLVFAQLYKLSLWALTSSSENLSPSCKGDSKCPQNLGNPLSRAGKHSLSKASCHHSHHKTKLGMNERTEPRSLISREAGNGLHHSEAPRLCSSAYIRGMWCCWIKHLEDTVGATRLSVLCSQGTDNCPLRYIKDHDGNRQTNWLALLEYLPANRLTVSFVRPIQSIFTFFPSFWL